MNFEGDNRIGGEIHNQNQCTMVEICCSNGFTLTALQKHGNYAK